MLSRLLLALALSLLALAARAETAAGSATVISLQGGGEFRPSSVAPWRPVAVNQQLTPGQSVRTGAHARMALLLSDQTQIRLNENTVLDVVAAAPGPRTAGQSKFRQLAGRAWVQSKAPPKDLQWETPTATAGIRGTDWEMEVAPDGRSLLSVLSGEIAFGNEFGQVAVKADEQALVEPGKAPVKMVVKNLKERVQWVTAYQPDPLGAITLEEAELPQARARLAEAATGTALRGRLLADLGRWSEAAAEFKAALHARPDAAEAQLGLAYVALRERDTKTAAARLEQAQVLKDGEAWRNAEAARRVLEQDIAGALNLLNENMARADLRQPAPWLMRADLAAYEGRLDDGLAAIRAGLERFPANDRLLAMRARLELLADRGVDAAASADRAVDSNLASHEGWLARADIARREGDAGTAMAGYDLAIAVKPDDARAWYGRGAALAERDYVSAARADLEHALALDPLGLGYQGEKGNLETTANEFAAADAAYKAALAANPADYVALTGQGLMELKRGNPQAALDAFLKAGLMEPHYARVHVYAAATYYKLGQVKQAESELARAAELDDKDPLPHFMMAMIDSDQLRPADAIAAARRAMARLPYLKSLNQLANDQQGSANLGQSFAFLGMEEWARAYAQESYSPYWAGSHLFLADRYNGLYTKNSELFQGLIADPTVFGASNRFKDLVPSPGQNLGLSLHYSHSDSLDGPSPQVELSGYQVDPKPYAYYLGYEGVDWELQNKPYDLHVATAAFGVKPDYDSGLFLFADGSWQDSSPTGSWLGSAYALDDSLDTRRLDLGFNRRLSPVSQIWLKAGYFGSDEDTKGMLAGNTMNSNTAVGAPEFGFRHALDLDGGHQLAWGLDYARRATDSTLNSDLWSAILPGFYIERNETALRENSADLFVSDTWRPSADLSLQGDLAYQDHDRDVQQVVTNIIGGSPGVPTVTNESHDQRQLSPRLGMVYRFNDMARLRLAWQNWLRPAGMSSLAPVATAGIPLDDRLVMRGGELNRLRLQGEWEANPSTFLTGYLDYKDIDNNRFTLRPFSVGDLSSLNKLRPRDFGALMRDDPYEFVDTPDYAGGIIQVAGLAVNRLLTREWAVIGRYSLTDSSNSTNSNWEVPYLPRHTVSTGATWIRPDGWYVAGLLTYRSKRYADEANTMPLAAGVGGDLDVFRESRDKHWLLRFSANDMFDKNQDTQYTAEVNYRF